MGIDGGEQKQLPESGAAEGSETMVEIKIKTMDSQTFSLRVYKSVPVPELKRQIASLTGVVSEQQHLICRGRVLKDDQRLSAYHVEDGHTLHLVVRQSIFPSPETFTDPGATDTSASSGNNPGNRGGQGVLIGSFNVLGDGDGTFPDLNRIFSAVINSGGGPRFGSREGIDVNRSPSELLTNAPRRLPSDHIACPSVSDSMQPPTIPDSLTTLSHYLSRLGQEFHDHGVDLNETVQNSGSHLYDGSEPVAVLNSSDSRRFLTPEFLAEVISSTRALLLEQANEYLQHLADQLGSQSSVTDISERLRIQSGAVRTGSLVQNVGFLLLELGRAIMTLRMGQTAADALVNAGPPLFISSSGPNPFSVQPPPFQPGTTVGSLPPAMVQSGSGMSGGSAAAGFVPRNVDIRNRIGLTLPRREANRQQTQGLVGAAVSSATSQQDVSVHNPNPVSRDLHSTPIPIRTVVANMPAAASLGTYSSSGPFGVFYPVFARFLQTSSENSTGSRNSQPLEQQHHNGQMPDAAPIGRSDLPHEAIDDRGISSQNPRSSGLEQLMSSIFAHEHDIHDNTEPEAAATEVPPTSNNPQETPSVVTDEGLLLSHMLRELLPMVSNDAGTISVEMQEGDQNPDLGTSSRRQGSPQTPQPSSKRQRMD